jgi:soluble lytic murein transglycosylase-like protein
LEQEQGGQSRSFRISLKERISTTKRKLILLLAALLALLVAGRVIAKSINQAPQLVEQNTQKQTETTQSTPEEIKTPPVASVKVVEPTEALVARYFPPSQVANAMTIIKYESGGNPNALSQTNDRGLFQINAVHIKRVNGDLSALFDPETNVKVAYAIWSEQGWSPWSTAWRL